MPQIRHLAALLLLLISWLPLAQGLLWAPALGGALGADPTVLFPVGPARGAALGLLLAGLGLLVSLLTVGAAIGIATGHRLGWWLGVIAAFGWLFTSCAPVALLVLAILVWPDVQALAFSRRGQRR